MRVVTAIFAASLGVACPGAYADSYEDNVLSLEVPIGFEGPHTAVVDQDVKTIVYVKGSTMESRTLLQVTIYDYGRNSKLPRPPKAQPEDAAEKYLLGFLRIIRKHRADFRASAPIRVMLNGMPAARASWKGSVGGWSMTGVTYAAVVGTSVVIFHTQALEDAPANNIAQVVRAFEAVRFKHGGQPAH